LLTEWADDFRRDFRHGLASLRRDPAFASIAVVALALGTGANAAIFSYVNSVVLGRSAYPGADRLVTIQAWSPIATSSSPIDYQAWRERARAFAQMAAEIPHSFNLTTGAEGPQRVPGALVSTNYFQTLGIQPLIGRGFTLAEEQPDREHVAVIANRLWRAAFGADPDIVGKSITLDGQLYAVAGVLPSGLFDLAPASVYTPLTFRAEQLYSGAYLNVIGRLGPGVTFEQALADMDRVVRLQPREGPFAHTAWVAVLTPIREQTLGAPMRKVVATLFAAVTLILLIACTNVAGLLVARGAARKREFAIRMALGAGRFRLVRQCLTENLAVSLCGGGLGLLLAVWLTRSRFESLLSVYFWHGKVAIDLRVLGFMLGLALLNTLLFGAAPAWNMVSAARGGLQQDLSGGRRGGMASALITIEVALTVTLLFGAGLFVRSLGRLLRVDLGVDPTNVLTFQVDLAGPRYSSTPQVSQYVDQFLSRLKSMPGVRAAGVTRILPLGQEELFNLASIEGRVIGPQFAFATPGYFAAAGIHLIKGRWFSSVGSASAPPVAVVSSAFAREYLPGQDPIGKQIVLGGDAVPRTITGVVGDVRFVAAEASGPGFYLPLAQLPAGTEGAIVHALHFVVRTGGEPAKLAPAIRGIAAQEDASQPVHDIASMEQTFDDLTQRERARAVLFAACSGLALLLAAVGIYAMLHYTVLRRTREIGVRMALGATPAKVVSLVMRWGFVPVALGAAAGCLCASALSHLVRALLFETSPYDPATYVAAIAATLAISLSAACVPALRAAKVDPMRALGCE
jgi:predicted permease